MKTGLKKSQKTTEIFFDEASQWITVNTYNTDLKNRLTAYAEKHPDLCRLDYAATGKAFFLYHKAADFCNYVKEWLCILIT